MARSKRGAEHRRFDVAPVSVRGFHQALQGIRAELDCAGVVEQIAVEVGDVVGPKESAAGHLVEQVAHHLVKPARVPELLLHNVGEEPIGKGRPASSAYRQKMIWLR